MKAGSWPGTTACGLAPCLLLVNSLQPGLQWLLSLLMCKGTLDSMVSQEPWASSISCLFHLSFLLVWIYLPPAWQTTPTSTKNNSTQKSTKSTMLFLTSFTSLFKISSFQNSAHTHSLPGFICCHLTCILGFSLPPL